MEEASRNRKTWDNFKTHFTTKNHEIQKTNRNAHAMGYSSNFMSGEGIEENENEAVTELSNLVTAETADREAMKNLP